MTLDPRHKGHEDVTHVVIWSKSIPGRSTSQCKGPEAGVWLVGLKNNKETGTAGAE